MKLFPGYNILDKTNVNKSLIKELWITRAIFFNTKISFLIFYSLFVKKIADFPWKINS